jgi:fused signal recognition particle receptor
MPESALVALPPPPDRSRQVDDPLEAAGFGNEVLAAAERLIGPPQRATAAQRLVDEMANIQLALQATDVAALRRSAGLIGRLLGRDVEAQERAEQLAEQLDICLLRADAELRGLQRDMVAQQRQAARVDVAVTAIEQWADAGEAMPAPTQEAVQLTLQRRLQHLRGVARLRQIEADQLHLLHAQGLELSERYQRIRDVLLPIWRQQALAVRAAQMPARLQQAADSQARILDEVAAMQARLR